MESIPICVLAGEWNCDTAGVWNFVLSKGMMARSVTITPATSLENLVDIVAAAFDIDKKKKGMKLSFWSSDVSNVLTQTRLPPVELTSDASFSQLKNMKLEGNKCHNIFITVVDNVDEADICQETDHSLLMPIIGLEESMLQLLETVEAAHRQGSGNLDSEEYSRNQHREGTLLPISKGGRGIPTPYTSEMVDEPIEADDDPVTQQGTPGFNLGIQGIDDPMLPSQVQDTYHDENECTRTAILQLDDPLFNDPPPDLDYFPIFEDEDSFYIGRIFNNKDELKNALSIYALRTFFNYRITKSDRTRFIAECVDGKCGWRVYAVGFIDSESFVIRTRHWEHSCGINSRSTYAKKATPKVLGEILHPKYANGKHGPRVCDLPDILLNDMHVDISYMRAWHAKEVALEKAWGKEEDNYKLLSSYLDSLSFANPGTHTNISTMDDHSGSTHFKYLFVALGASIFGYQFLRKVIVIDGTQLKGKYKGCLVAACCQDGNMQIYPLAFGVVDSENDDSWVWFLENLKCFVTDEDNLLFVSDRHQSIISAIRKVFPLAHHAYCIVHLFRNIKQRFKCEGLASIVSRAARAFTHEEFQLEWSQIEKKSVACADYLKKIGFTHWTRVHCPARRYNLMSSNISESLNAALQKSVNFPIITMLEFVRTLLMRWFASRREKAARCYTHCTPEVESILVDNMRTSSSFKTISASYFIYQVQDSSGNSFTVDLQHKTCSCKVFESLGIPCPHATAATKKRGINIYTFVDPCYGTEYWEYVYQKVVMPVPNFQTVTPPDTVDFADEVLPPCTRRPPGRPKRCRIPSVGEYHKDSQFKAPRCGRCFEAGHNRKTCKNAI